MTGNRYPNRAERDALTVGAVYYFEGEWATCEEIADVGRLLWRGVCGEPDTAAIPWQAFAQALRRLSRAGSIDQTFMQHEAGGPPVRVYRRPGGKA